VPRHLKIEIIFWNLLTDVNVYYTHAPREKMHGLYTTSVDVPTASRRLPDLSSHRIMYSWICKVLVRPSANSAICYATHHKRHRAAAFSRITEKRLGKRRMKNEKK
jgi:hypothetical protein